LSGALIPVWRQIKNVKDQALKIVRTTTDEGVRLVGLQIPKASVKKIVRLFDCSWRTEESLAEIYENVICGKESLGLAENVRLKAAKVFGDYYVEIVPAHATHPKKFRAFGLTSITVNYRERFFLPQEASAAINLLQKLVSHFPPVGTNTDIQSAEIKCAEKNDFAPVQAAGLELPPIDVREWLIEPEKEELARISLSDSLIND